jgi:bifunctional non-homologous end joining protein LigD
MKAVSDVLPHDDGWAFEVKWDGMRILAACDGGQLRLWSGRSNDVTASFGELQALADELPTTGCCSTASSWRSDPGVARTSVGCSSGCT